MTQRGAAPEGQLTAPLDPTPPTDATHPVTRYVSLDEARAIECNGCGDCCDSRRTAGFWTWGDLPADQYAPMNAGAPLIIPLEAIGGGGWRDRARTELDGAMLSMTRFRCAAFESAPDDSSGSCRLHDRERPARCGEFPAGGVAIERELREQGEAPLQTGAFPRCSWYAMVVVPDADPRRATNSR
ncbi:MAG: hypothetical protein EXR63_02680 [Dehalococcoidia bacterium]|nr:hypothetical protein [Dehalococcoidia bacterium]